LPAKLEGYLLALVVIVGLFLFGVLTIMFCRLIKDFRK
jgi:hypothetical protein